MLLYRKAGATALLIAIGLIASFSFTWPANTARLGSVSLDLSGDMLLGIVLFALAWNGTHWAIHPRASDLGRSTFPHCILPSAFTVAAWTLITLPIAAETRLLGAAVSSVALVWLIISEHHVMYNSTLSHRAKVQWFIDFAVYGVAMLLYLAIALPIDTPTAMALEVALATAALGIRLLADTLFPASHASDSEAALPRPTARPLAVLQGWLLVLALALSSGFLSWLLKALVPRSLAYSLALVVSLYGLAGIARHYLLGTLTRRVVVEYLLVALACLFLVLINAR